MKLKGFILAAGYGTRLKPITNKIPKAIVKLGDRFLFEYGLELLRKNGIVDVGINIHYKKDLIEKYASERKLITFYEKNLLGTGGYLKNLGRFFDCNMVVVNCDVVFFNEGSLLQNLITMHIQSGNLITLVLKKITNENATLFEVDGNKVRSLGHSGNYFFTGLQVVSPEVLPFIEFSIVDVYKKLINQNRIGFIEFDGCWFDCGTLDGLIRANKHLFNSSNNVFYQNVEVSSEVIVKNSVLYNCKIEGYGEIENSIIYEGANLCLNGEKIINKIIV